MNIHFDYKKSCRLSYSLLKRLSYSIVPFVDYLASNKDTLHNTHYEFVQAPHNNQLLEQLQILSHTIQSYNPTVLIIIGIGGSNLGIKAIQEALRGTLYNETNPPLKVYYADTVDSSQTATIMQLAKRKLESNNTVIVTIISKSGSTIETQANAELFIELLKRYKKDEWNKYIVITTNKGSTLFNFALKHSIVCLEIPPTIAGRYSVFTVVGLFPLLLLGIDIEALCQGAQSFNIQGLKREIEYNPSLASACMLYYYNQRGYTIHDTFLFSPECESLGKWYRQLLAESIGKKYDNNDKQVHTGILPTVSIGSTDLHSVGQLYLAGPATIFTTFVTIQEGKEFIHEPTDYAYQNSIIANPTADPAASIIAGKNFKIIMNAIVEGTKRAYYIQKRPYVSFVLPQKNEYYLGQLIQCKMFEVMYLGHLLNVNPFDQPAVESYKQETYKLLM